MAFNIFERVISMPQKTALYIRVSTQEQAQEGYSIEAQTSRLTSYCKAKDWPIVEIYTDPGFSGSNTERPALQRLFADIEAGRIDCVLVYKLDRLSRSQKDTLYIIEDVFLSHNVAFVSMQENFVTSTPFGRAMIGILSVFAQLEREQIRERMNMGRLERAKDGFFHGGGFRPFGYDYEDGQLHINQMEALIVRDVYSMFLEHTPINKIEEILLEKYGRTIRHTAIRSILSTPIYIGLISWEGHTYPGRHEAIIDTESYTKAQELLNDRARIAASKPFPFRSTTLLGGLLFCGNCGAAYFAKGNYSGHGSNKTYRAYYYCYSRGKTTKRKIIDPTCINPAYPVKELDKRILAEIERLVSDDSYFNSVVSLPGSQKSADTERQKYAIMQRMDEIDLQISRVIDLYQLGTISMDDIGARTTKLQNEKDALQKTLASMAPKHEKKLSAAEARTLLDEYFFIMENGETDEKKALLHSLIKKIIVKPTVGEFDIIWNF